MARAQLTHAQVSLRVFGSYMLVAGALFMIAPEVLLDVLHLTAGDETWIRMFGLLAIVIGYNHQVVVSKNLVDIIGKSSRLRYFGALVMTSLVGLNLAGRGLLVLAAIDVLTATWTVIALGADRKRASIHATHAEPALE